MKLNMVEKNGYTECGDCGGLIVSDAEWLGEDENGTGRYEWSHRCECCGNWIKEKGRE